MKKKNIYLGHGLKSQNGSETKIPYFSFSKSSFHLAELLAADDFPFWLAFRSLSQLDLPKPLLLLVG
jgi:hypothetical protein